MSSSAVSFSQRWGREDRPHGVSWTIWAGTLAITSSLLGGTWDVAWHRSIGRDSFLTPAHLMIYACGVIAAVVCGYLIFYTTFGGSARLKAESVSVLGFRAPLGAFIAAWGGLAMLTSAPFDNWWHNAYGLDVQIISPPHTVLILGIRGISIGITFLVLAAMNRLEARQLAGALDAAGTSEYKTLQAIFLYIGGLTMVGQMFFLQEETWDVVLHTTGAYVALAIGVPVALAVFWRASRNRWASTICATVYTLYVIAEIQIFPLVPATPKLGPVFNPITHLIPGKFPILIIVPAIALDLLWQRTGGWKRWQVAAVSGVVFVALIFAVEWPFADFLLSKASENRFFGTIYFDYNSMPDKWDRARQYFEPASGWKVVWGLVRASIFGAISTWIGMFFGDWMRGVER